jgi:hypothetical protein
MTHRQNSCFITLTLRVRIFVILFPYKEKKIGHEVHKEWPQWLLLCGNTHLSLPQSFAGVQWLSCSPLDRSFAGSNPTEDDGFLTAIRLWTVAANRPIFHPTNNVPVRRPTVEWSWQGEAQNSESSQCNFVLHNSQMDWPGREPVTRGQGVTAWTMARPSDR